MAENCSTCGKQLTFRDSFIWEGKPICKICLKKAEEAMQSQTKLPETILSRVRELQGNDEQNEAPRRKRRGIEPEQD